jgi:hypothetical protein
MRISKARLDALEKLFSAEIDGRLPFQSKAKIYVTLCDEGLALPMEVKLGGRFPVRILGYELTHAGRILYCSHCSVVP